MRFALAVLSALYSSGAFAVCSTKGLAGVWTFAAGSTVCVIRLDENGSGWGECNAYRDSETLSHQIEFTSVSLGNDCRLRGTVSDGDIIGQADPAMTMIVGALVGVGAFTMVR